MTSPSTQQSTARTKHSIWDVTNEDVFEYGRLSQDAPRRGALALQLQNALEHAQWWLRNQSHDTLSIPPFLLALSILSRCQDDIGRDATVTLLAALQSLPHIRDVDVPCLFSLSRDLAIRMSNGMLLGPRAFIIMAQALDAINLRLITHAYLGHLTRFDHAALHDHLDNMQTRLKECYRFFEEDAPDYLLPELRRCCDAGVRAAFLMPVNFEPYSDTLDEKHPPQELAYVLRLFWPHCCEEVQTAELLMERLEAIVADAFTSDLYLALCVLQVLFEIAQCPNSTVASWALHDHPCSLWSLLNALKSGYVECTHQACIEAVIIAYLRTLRHTSASVAAHAEWLYSSIPMGFPHINLSLLQKSAFHNAFVTFQRDSFRTGGASVLGITLVQSLMLPSMQTTRNPQVPLTDTDRSKSGRRPGAHSARLTRVAQRSHEDLLASTGVDGSGTQSLPSSPQTLRGRRVRRHVHAGSAGESMNQKQPHHQLQRQGSGPKRRGGPQVSRAGDVDDGNCGNGGGGRGGGDREQGVRDSSRMRARSASPRGNRRGRERPRVDVGKHDGSSGSSSKSGKTAAGVGNRDERGGDDAGRANDESGDDVVSRVRAKEKKLLQGKSKKQQQSFNAFMSILQHQADQQFPSPYKGKKKDETASPKPPSRT
ncbi:hypothetical protein PTSG_11767 [Salpingoeca rosetta]|uniref:Uncharacterized protein n=1 Tax=Salpingoeca rosetta (strain ATCC 50818 / BSB-021) TaxID=946362 RepID=F2TYM4_SALR5|nr:uncharacterized protein PTSG_11767 [Salpingoeca rosetta]EGD78698.1 hypothetical protein PTSG_11767 [Salpingoeca rosetta]|eukprot:XP_004997655.1 hypothetical protein PTSG_11767 [Salpingoeca rosetta]